MSCEVQGGVGKEYRMIDCLLALETQIANMVATVVMSRPYL